MFSEMAYPILKLPVVSDSQRVDSLSMIGAKTYVLRNQISSLPAISPGFSRTGLRWPETRPKNLVGIRHGPNNVIQIVLPIQPIRENTFSHTLKSILE
jgi:hypothetical protein